MHFPRHPLSMEGKEDPKLRCSFFLLHYRSSCCSKRLWRMVPSPCTSISAVRVCRGTRWDLLGFVSSSSPPLVFLLFLLLLHLSLLLNCSKQASAGAACSNPPCTSLTQRRAHDRLRRHFCPPSPPQPLKL